MFSSILNYFQNGRVVKTPTILQMEMTECGAASLAMVMAYYKLFIPLEKLRIDCGVSRDGSNALNVIKAARAHGFDANGFRYEPDDLLDLELPLILHWKFNHFIVLEGRKGNTFYINDPASGRRSVDYDEFDRSFTGLALQITPSENFESGGKPEPLVRALFSRLKNVKTAMFYIFFCSVLMAIPGIVIPTISRIFVDDVLGQNPDWLLSLIIALISTAIVNVYLMHLDRSAMMKLSLKFTISSTSSLFHHLLRMPAEFYYQRSPGELQYRMQLNNRISSLLSGQAGSIFTSLFMVLLYLIIMFEYDVLLASIGVSIALLNIVVLKLVNESRIITNQALIQETGKMVGVTASGIQLAETIKATAADFDFFSKWAGHQAKVVNKEQKMSASSIYTSALPQLLSGINSTIILIFGAWRVIHGDMTMGMLVAFQSIMAGFLHPVSQLMGIGVQVQEAKGCVDKVNDVLKYPRDAVFNRTAKNKGESDKLVLEGEFELKDITFGYAPLGDPLIKNFNLHIKPGQRVAVVGRSGSGKSTVGKIAAGLYKPWSGKVLLDGKPLSEYSREALGNSLAIVDQDIAMFSGTIRDNLTMWNPLRSDKEIIASTIDADIHSDIVLRSGGYSTELIEDGRNFSGGQRQRIEIARAIINNPSVLIMDEATSALDPETEKEIDNNLRRRGCSCLIVAHRLSTIRDCDEIVVMEKGEIVQRGTHEQLLLEEGGYYSKLIKSE